MGFGDGALGKCLDHASGALTNEIDLHKRHPRGSLAPSIMWGHSEKMVVIRQEVGFHQNLVILTPWSSTSQSPELWGIKLCCLEATQARVFCDGLNGLRHTLNLETILSHKKKCVYCLDLFGAKKWMKRSPAMFRLWQRRPVDSLHSVLPSFFVTEPWTKCPQIVSHYPLCDTVRYNHEL